MIPFLLLSALLFSRCGSPSSDSREERVNNDSLKTTEMDSNAEVNALPYQLEFVLQQYNNNNKKDEGKMLTVFVFRNL